jgi:hypothetical protein
LAAGEEGKNEEQRGESHIGHYRKN